MPDARGVQAGPVGTDGPEAVWVGRAVLALTVVLVLAALVSIAVWGRNIPLAEDWNMVPALTGNEPDLGAWLWSQNNEHRLPVQRAIYLLLLRLTEDFRSGMVLNVALLAALALGLARVAARLRGRPAWSDAVFPLALLHLGHWENMVWGWQIQFVWSCALSGLLLCLVVLRAGPIGRREAVAVVSVLPLLALSGANGIVLSAAMLPWVGIQWLAHRGGTSFGATPDDASPATATILLCGAAATVLAIAFYFTGYESPSWSPPMATLPEFVAGTQNVRKRRFIPIVPTEPARSIAV